MLIICSVVFIVPHWLVSVGLKRTWRYSHYYLIDSFIRNSLFFDQNRLVGLCLCWFVLIIIFELKDSWLTYLLQLFRLLIRRLMTWIDLHPEVSSLFFEAMLMFRFWMVLTFICHKCIKIDKRVITLNDKWMQSARFIIMTNLSFLIY